MQHSLIPLLACPYDHQSLTVSSPVDDGAAGQTSLRAGELACPTCSRRFAVRSGIPVFVKAQDLASVQLVEVEKRNQGYQSVDPRVVEAWRLPEWDTFHSALGDVSNRQVLDAGCGAGNITRMAAGAVHVVGLDFSLEALLRFNGDGYRSLDLVNGDVSRLPFGDELFDVCVSSQVLEHLPTADLRHRFIGELARVLKAEGRVLLSVYNWSENHRKLGEPKEGHHDNGIFYHRYDSDELHDEFEPYFDIQSIVGIRSVLPLTYHFVRALGSGIVYWDRLWRNRSLSRKYGAYLFINASRRAGKTLPHR